MNVLIVHAHPEPASFNSAMTRLACETLRAAGHQVALSDLYAMQFHAASDRSNFATVQDPSQFAEGMDWVLVLGTPVQTPGGVQATDALVGRPITGVA